MQGPKTKEEFWLTPPCPPPRPSPLQCARLSADFNTIASITNTTHQPSQPIITNDASRITIDDSRVMLQSATSLTDNSRGNIYYHSMLTVRPQISQTCKSLNFTMAATNKGSIKVETIL